MQFFEQQDQARGRTTLLVVLFTVAVVLIVGAIGLATHFTLSIGRSQDEPLLDSHFGIVATAAITAFGIILLGSAYRLTQLRRGGVKIAETLGGTLVTAQSPDLLERRAVHVVEEMAIASGLPVPPVYVMQRETGINAFAAGWSPDDAVIGVTKGTLESLSRDQLQGVIAHEFSHILNRDCALNMKLIGVLHGIVMISVIGRIMMRFGSGGRSRGRRGNGAAQFLLAGLVVWILGSLGVLAARLIQAAVSRQREYLADASAVQFTRNPQGIAGALATIGSQTSALSTPRGGETSHMLISEPSSKNFFGALASHPPLFDRIHRVLPGWDGNFAALATPAGSVRKSLASGRSEPRADGGGAVDVLLGGVGGAMGPAPMMAPMASATAAGDPRLLAARQLLDGAPPRLLEAARGPYSARALILAWVLDADPDDRAAQLALVGRDASLASETERLEREIPALDPLAVLPLFDVALGALAALSERQKRRFHSLLLAVSAQLSSRSYRGYCLAALCLRHLAPEVRVKKKPVLIKDAIETVLGILAVEGHDTTEAAAAAFFKGIGQLGKRGKNLRMPDPKALNVTALDAAFSTLIRLPTVTRAKLLNAAEFIASSDGVLRPSEAELLRAMANCLSVAAEPAFATAPK